MSNKIKQTFSTLLKPLENYWHRMPEKDRRALSWLGAVSAIAILIFGIFLPAQEFHHQSQVRMDAQQKTYVWLKSQESKAKNLKPASKSAVSSQSLLTIATETARNNGLTLKRVQPDGNDRIRLWLEDVPFNQVLITIDKLQSDFGLTIEEFSADKKQPGKVDARATIAR